MSEPDRLLDGIEEILEHTSARDYDGHSSFAELAPAERLDWLDEIAGFVAEFKGCAAPSSRPADQNSEGEPAPG
jgi:hypothetical protein